MAITVTTAPGATGQTVSGTDAESRRIDVVAYHPESSAGGGVTISLTTEDAASGQIASGIDSAGRRVVLVAFHPEAFT